MEIHYGTEIRRYRIAPSLGDELIQLFERYNRRPAKKRWTDTPVSYKTAYRRFVNTCATFQDLARIGYPIQHLANLGEKHVAALVREWEAAGHGVGTIENKLSYLRWVCKWIGKPGMVKPGRTYAAKPERFRRSTVATEDKSWSGNGVDVLAIVERLRTLDKIVAAQAEIAMALGVRAEEAMLLRPARALEDAMNRGAVRIEFGVKGGRPRDVIVDNPAQIDVLARAAMLARAPNATMIPANRTLEQWRNHFYYVLRRCGIKKDTTDGGLGVTLHGVRHEFLQQLFERITGLPAPVKGKEVEYDREQYRAGAMAVVAAAGHSDRYKSGAYLGSPRAMRRLRQALTRHNPNGGSRDAGKSDDHS